MDFINKICFIFLGMTPVTFIFSLSLLIVGSLGFCNESSPSDSPQPMAFSRLTATQELRLKECKADTFKSMAPKDENQQLEYIAGQLESVSKQTSNACLACGYWLFDRWLRNTPGLYGIPGEKLAALKPKLKQLGVDIVDANEIGPTTYAYWMPGSLKNQLETKLVDTPCGRYAAIEDFFAGEEGNVPAMPLKLLKKIDQIKASQPFNADEQIVLQYYLSLVYESAYSYAVDPQGTDSPSCSPAPNGYDYFPRKEEFKNAAISALSELSRLAPEMNAWASERLARLRQGRPSGEYLGLLCGD